MPVTPRVNSARLTGGEPPPVHFKMPPQSPVVHTPLPLLSKLQPVLAQNLPDQPGGAVSGTDEPGGNGNPPSPRRVAPLPDNVPGHIV